jgi:hypothetical protein
VFRIPPAPRRRKKRTQEDILLARLKKAEELLRAKGIEPDNSSKDVLTRSTAHASTSILPTTVQTPAAVTAASVMLPASPENRASDSLRAFEEFLKPPFAADQTGQLLVGEGKSRFVENNLWASLSNEFRDGTEAFAEDSDDDEEELRSPFEEDTEFVLGYSPSGGNAVYHLHPSATNIFVLWQVFLENVNPMTKILHRPTMQKTLVQACTQLDNLPKGLEALMFSIYAGAVYTMEDDECVKKLGESRRSLLARYRHATRKALARAKFMATSELVVLQAFLLYLLLMREDYDARTVYVLAGVASRVAQSMGLHRDGSLIGTTPFETEIRRRVWWQVTALHGRSAELSGSGRFLDFATSDTLIPTNVNDEELYPEMKELPAPQTRPTEMISVMLRCDLGQYWREKKSGTSFEDLRLAPALKTTVGQRDEFLDGLEQRLEDKFLRYCDPSIPIQFMTIIIGRGAINSMRILAHHPRRYADKTEVSAVERDYLWKASVKLLEGLNLAHSSPQLRRFMWHTRVHFVWQAFICVLDQLKERTLGDEVDSAWSQVAEVYRHHPHFLTDYKRPLHLALGSLCCKAYAIRERALMEHTNGVLPTETPDYILKLREQRERLSQSSRSASVSGSVKSPAWATGSSNVPRLSPAPLTAPPATTNWDAVPHMSQFLDNPHYSQTISPFSQSTLGLSPGMESQMPLPPLQSMGIPFQNNLNANVFSSEPLMAHDLAMSDMPIDWGQWDLLMQDTGQPVPDLL